jgi:tRNA(Ile2) C34 agmatinyltransferase TiaS
MIILTPNDVKQRFGLLFSKKFLVMVDEKTGLAEILEQCHARGTIEWDAMNRSRAGGAVIACAVKGNTMTIKACLGSIGPLCDFVRSFVEEHTFSKDTGIAFIRGIGAVEPSPMLKALKTEIVALNHAEHEARRLGVEFLDTNGRKGRIGALGALLWGNRGIEAAGLYGEHL